MKKILTMLFLMSFSSLTINKLQAQELKTTKPSQTTAPAVLNYEGIDLMPFEINGLHFYETPEIATLDYYLVQVFFDENLKITKSEEIYSVVDRKKLNSRDVYSVYSIFNNIVGYLSAYVESSPNGEYYTVSHTEKEGKEYMCIIDIYKNNKQVDSYKFNPKDYEDYQFQRLRISNKGEIIIFGLKKEKKENLPYIFKLTKNGLEEELALLDVLEKYEYEDINITFNLKDELIIVSSFVELDNKDRSGGFAISKLDEGNLKSKYTFFEKEVLDIYKSSEVAYLSIAPNGDIIFSSSVLKTWDYLHSNYKDGCAGKEINILSFSDKGDLNFTRKIDRYRVGAVACYYKTILTDKGIYTFYNHQDKSESSKVCKINYEGEIEFEDDFASEKEDGFCTPSMVVKLSDNTFIYYLFIRKENKRLLEIIE